MPIIVDVDVMLARRKMPVGTLAERIGITGANLAVLKNGRAKAVRFSTLAAICEVLDCQPGDVLRYEPDDVTRDADCEVEPGRVTGFLGPDGGGKSTMRMSPGIDRPTSGTASADGNLNGSSSA